MGAQAILIAAAIAAAVYGGGKVVHGVKAGTHKVECVLHVKKCEPKPAGVK
jgi:hypothetical protein